MGLPYAAHSHLPLLLSVCQFLMKFVGVLQSSYCLVSVVGQRSFVQTVANYGILARSNSFIGRNVMFLRNRFHLSAADFKFGQASHLSNTISRHHLDTASDEDLYAVNFAAELLCLRNQIYTFPNDVVLNKDDLNDLLSVVLCE